MTPAGKGATVPDIGALRRLRRIAVGDPAAVPVGVYARQYLERRGLWSTLEPRLLPLANARAARPDAIFSRPGAAVQALFRPVICS